MYKQQILRELDETGLLSGVMVNRALLANDRAKYALTLLQLAFEQARHPQENPENLSRERAHLELEDPSLDAIVPSAARGADRRVVVPGAKSAVDLLTQSCREMLEPIASFEAPECTGLAERLAKLFRQVTPADETALSEDWLEDLTRGIRGGPDSIHLWVMDAHRVLNRIQRDLSETRVDGVPAIGIEEGDRHLVRAFVSGVRRTMHLKLDHPGLGTTASRYSGRLVIQNDVGLTDCHVVVIGVSDAQVEVTYTDLHGRRLAFFRQMLDPLLPEWKDFATRSSTQLEEGEKYYVLRGTIASETPEEKARALEHIGSRLVFLIDWNKARKRLRNFLPNKCAVRVLEKAASDEVGHMAFLKWGGEELVYQALDVAAGDRLRYGEPLHAAIGTAVAETCFHEILRICREGIANGESMQVIRDRIVAVFSRALAQKTSGLLRECRRQAALVVEAALTLHQIMRFLRIRKDARQFVLRSHKRIELWENEADQILNQVRRKERSYSSSLPVRELSGAIDDALDSIDRGAFFLSRLEPERLSSSPLRGLTELTSLLVRSAQEFYKAIATVSEGPARRSQEDLPEFFESVGRLDVLTKLKDAQEREYLEDIFEMGESSGRIQRWREIGTRISSAVDHLSRAAFVLYDSIFSPGQIGH